MAAQDQLDGVTAGSELTVAMLETELTPVAAKWKALGQTLGLDEWMLNNIAANHPIEDGACERRLRAVLVKWDQIKEVTDRSWQAIIYALREMNENSLARKIENQYCHTVQGLSPALSLPMPSEEAVALADTNRLRMKDHFARLQILVGQKIQERLEANTIKIENVRLYITTLFPEECIPETSEISEIFTAITHSCLWDYYNYEPLMRVADMFAGKDQDFKAELKAYKECLVGYKMVTKMTDCLTNVTSTSYSESDDESESSLPPVRKDRHYRKKLTIKLKLRVSEKSLSYVDEVWTSVAETFLLPHSSAVLDKIMEGSLCITWLIPAFFVPQIMEKIEHGDVVGFFREMKIEILIIDEVCLYEEQEVVTKKVTNTSKEDSVFNDSSAEIQQGYSSEIFTSPPPEDLKCRYCLMVLRNPYQSSCCKSLYCKVCCDKIKSVEQSCQHCKSRNFSSFPDRNVQLKVNALKVKCPCGWEGELQWWESVHIDTCEARVKCSQCHQEMFRRTLRVHKPNCPRRWYTCEHCQQHSGIFSEVREHHYPKCEHFPVLCPNRCVMTLMPQGQLMEHMWTCPEKGRVDDLLGRLSESAARVEEKLLESAMRMEREIAPLRSREGTEQMIGVQDVPSSKPDPIVKSPERLVGRKAPIYQLGYRNELFMRSPPRQLMCNICLMVLRHVYQSSCCNNLICKACCEVVKFMGRSCPFCRNKEFPVIPNRKVQLKVNALRVNCPCGWEGELQQWESVHVNTCEARVKCALCNEEMPQWKLKDHKPTCPCRWHVCEYCHKHIGIYKEVRDCHYPKCEHYPVPCPNCCDMTPIPQGQLLEHLWICPAKGRVEDLQRKLHESTATIQEQERELASLRVHQVLPQFSTYHQQEDNSEHRRTPQSTHDLHHSGPGILARLQPTP